MATRQPKCSRCRHHGIIVPQKGHTKYCPFLKCECWKCYLITERTRITALQRNLKRAQNKPQNKEQRLCAQTGVSAVKPAAEGTFSASSPDGGARPSATSDPTRPLSEGATESAATTALYSLDLRSRPAAGGENVAGLDSGKVLPYVSSEEGSCTPFSAPYFGNFGQTAPLPVIHFPFRMSGHCPSSYEPCPNFLLNMSWLPPVSAGLYSNGLCGPLMFPRFQPGAVHYPPPSQPGPPADCRQVFFTLQPPPLPEPFQVELTSMQHLQPPLSNTEDRLEELD